MSARDDWVQIGIIHKGYGKGEAWLVSDDGLVDDVATNRAFTSLAWAKRFARSKSFSQDKVRFVRPNPETNPQYFEIMERRPR